MDREILKQEISLLVRDLFTAQGFVLVDIIFRQDGSGLLLSLLVDRPQGGISLEECGLLNRLVRQALDEKNIFSGQYSLEVSSPGLGRLLKTKEDFMRCLNKQAVFSLSDLVNGKCEWKGLISRVGEYSVFIDRLENHGWQSNSQSHKPEGNGLASDSAEAHGLPSSRQSQAKSHKPGETLEIPLIKINKAKLVIQENRLRQ